MKNIEFALLVFCIPLLFPVYLVVELRRGVTETSNHTFIDGNFKEATIHVPLLSQRKTETSFYFHNYTNDTSVIGNDVVKRFANTRHKRFNN
jgi:hypothetical protein